MRDHFGYKIIDVYYISSQNDESSISNANLQMFLSHDEAHAFLAKYYAVNSGYEVKSYKAIKLVNYSRADNRVIQEFYKLGEKIDYLTELSRKNDLRNRALQKLTKEEIEALGI